MNKSFCKINIQRRDHISWPLLAFTEVFVLVKSENTIDISNTKDYVVSILLFFVLFLCFVLLFFFFLGGGVKGCFFFVCLFFFCLF